MGVEAAIEVDWTEELDPPSFRVSLKPPLVEGPAPTVELIFARSYPRGDQGKLEDGGARVILSESRCCSAGVKKQTKHPRT